jgi:hypothetical protein
VTPYTSGSQPMFRGTLVFCKQVPSVPQKNLNNQIFGFLLSFFAISVPQEGFSMSEVFPHNLRWQKCSTTWKRLGTTALHSYKLLFLALRFNYLKVKIRNKIRVTNTNTTKLKILGLRSGSKFRVDNLGQNQCLELKVKWRVNNKQNKTETAVYVIKI